LLYNILSTHDWSCVYGSTSVDSAVASLNAAAQDAMEQTIACGIINTNSKFPHWYSSSLRYYIREKNYFYRRSNKINPTVFTTVFLSIVNYLTLLLSLTNLYG
jgi:hypothetical protein